MRPHSLCYQFFAVCVPLPDVFGEPRIYGMLETLLSPTRPGVQKLEKLLVENLVKMAIDNPERSDKLKEFLNENSPLELSRFIFSDCELIIAFILNWTPLEPYVIHEPMPRVLFCVENDSTTVILSEKSFYVENYPFGEIPIEKIVKLFFIIFKQPPRTATFLINKDVAGAESMADRITDLIYDERCAYFYVTVSDLDEYIRVFFHNE